MAAGAVATARRSARLAFGSKTSEFYREKIEFPFFQYYLKGKGSSDFPGGVGFRDGDERVAEIRRVAAQERQAAIDLFARTRWAFLEPPGDNGSSAAEDAGHDEYISDPAHPVEYIDQIEIRMTGDYMTQDQRSRLASAGRPGI